jgi:hypothetical protein
LRSLDPAMGVRMPLRSGVGPTAGIGADGGSTHARPEPHPDLSKAMNHNQDHDSQESPISIELTHELSLTHELKSVPWADESGG